MITRRAVNILRSFIALFHNRSSAANLAARARRVRKTRYARSLANVTPARRLLCVIACFGLILSSQPVIPRSAGKSAEKPNAHLTQGPPGLNLPDLNEARLMNLAAPKIPPLVSASASNIAPPATTPAPTQEDNWPMALIDQRNRVGTGGEDLLSRNYNWGAPIVSLPGRAGMDLNLGLSLNSLIWTRSGTNIYFDLDQGFPSPGFKLGFPEIRTLFQNTETGTGSALVIMPSGGRYEFRANPALGTNVYEEMGGSHMLLVFKQNPINVRDSTWTLLPPDGSAYKFKVITNNVKCIEAKDRNGNFISIAYNSLERISAITDTLGRVVNFNYDGSNRLISIIQSWGNGAHTYATFAYENVTIQTNFPGLELVGVASGTTISALSRMNMADGKVYAFEYNSYAQVRTVRCYAPNSANPGNFPGDYTLLSSVSYDLTPNAGGPQTDCPRFFTRIDWAKDANGGALTSYDGDGATWGAATTLDGTTYKEFFGASGWQRGLTLQTETWSNGSRKKWTASTWVNDNPNVSYWLNPRVVETNIYDDSGNQKRTTIAYADFGAVSDVREYDAPPNTSTVLRRTHFDYLRGAAYTGNTNRRLTQLVTSKSIYDGNGTLNSKATYEYDLGGQYLVNQGPPVRHDTANFGVGFVQGRGNLNVVRRWDVTDPNNINKSVAITTGHNTSGSVIFSRDALNHQMSMSYADAFSDSSDRNTLAYPTMVTNADHHSSTVQYNYDFGAETRRQNPKEAAVVTTYDSIGRLDRVTNQVNGAYTRYVYAPDHLSVQSYTTVNDLSSELYQITVFDGHGRPRGVASGYPGSAGGYKAQNYEYDIVGRLVRQTNPTEVNSAWEPVGDDAAGWVWSRLAYDWKGRPTLTTNQRGNTSIIDYEGCACAGGEVVTIQDEGQVNNVGGVPTLQRRKTRIINDALGRERKRLVFNWDGTVYASTTTTYNVLDQVTSVKQYKGDGDGVSCPTATCQETTTSYDGQGRLAARRLPQDDGNTTYTYYANDLLQSATDARGATGTFTYNNRGLMTGANYSGGGGVATPSVSFDYDELGKPRWMEDGPGRMDYIYDSLGRLMSETRRFDALPGMAFQFSYDYNLAGEIKQVTDPRGDAIYYGYDSGGSLTGVTGSSFAGVTNYATGFQYRAWGQPKRVDYGDSFHAEIGHDAQMNVTNFNIPGVLGANYTLNEDGRIRSAHPLTNPLLTTSFEWDHMGRLTKSEEVDADIPIQVPWQYVQNYGYDEYGNMISRDGVYWNTFTNRMSATYSRGRAVSSHESDNGPLNPTYDRSFQYDAMGNTTQVATAVSAQGQQPGSATTNLLYDSVGRPSESGTELDGYGRVVKKGQEYNLISTPFGGQILTILDNNGQKTKGRVYIGTDLLAEQLMMSGQPSEVVWRHRDPMNTSARDTKSGGWKGSLWVVDPLGTMLPMAETAQQVTDAQIRLSCSRVQSPVCNGQPAPSSYYTPNWGTFSSGNSSGQWAGGCGAFASASVSCGNQMNLFNHMSKDMLEGYQRYAQTLVDSGYFNNAGAVGREVLASSLSGVTAAGVGGTYTLKPIYKEEGWDGHPLRRLVGFGLGLVPGGDPEPQGGGPQPYDPRADFRDYAEQLSNGRNRSDCLKLALLAYKAGQVWGNQGMGAVARGMLNGLTEYSSAGGERSDPNFRVGVFQRDPHFGRGFGDTGFKPGYRDTNPTGPRNQVRHFTFYLAAGVQMGSLANIGLYEAEGTSDSSVPDVGLGETAITMGLTQFNKNKDPFSPSKFAQDIWKNVCGETEPLKLP